MKLIVLLLAMLLLINPNFAQQDTPVQKPFYIFFCHSGLGSNMGSFQPRFILNGTSFVYTYEQNSYFGVKDERKDTISTGSFNQSSIDSINYLIKEIRDSNVYLQNPCIMSGGIDFLTISNGTDTTSIELVNTIDTTSIKIINVINGYLPADKQILINEEYIQWEKDCWADLSKRHETRKKKKANKHTYTRK